MKFVKAFYNHYNIILPKLKIPGSRKRGILLSIDEARIAINNCNGKYKPIFHLQLVSGFDISTQCSLNYFHFVNVISDEISIKDAFDIFDINPESQTK